MTGYEELLEKAENSNIHIHENYDFSGTRIKGLYCDGNIALSKDLRTYAEKKCILAEEIGHHITSSGDITDQTNVMNRKQEQRARAWAYQKLISFEKLIEAYNAGCKSKCEIAEYLDVTEEFLEDAIERYRCIYSPYKKIDNHIVFFEPRLAVLEIKDIY